MENAEIRCHDSGFCVGHFLGPMETLTSVIAKDAETLSRLCITTKQVADRVEDLMEKYRTKSDYRYRLDAVDAVLCAAADMLVPWNLNGNDINAQTLPRRLVDGNWVVTSSAMKGLQQCPWLCGGGCVDFSIYNIRKKKGLRISGLHLHLIREHGFFEGDVLYRVEPSEVVDVLELVPSANYAPQWSHFDEWSLRSGYVIDFNTFDMRLYRETTIKGIYSLLANDGKEVFIINQTGKPFEITVSNIVVEGRFIIVYSEYELVRRSFVVA